MGTRSVRLDEETERALGALASATGASVSEILKRGVLSLRDATLNASPRGAWQVYRELDLGPGGDALAPARESKRAVGAVLRARHKSRR